MKRALILLSAFFVLTAMAVAVNAWKMDKPNSQLTFSITHLGIADVSGSFNDFDVNLSASKSDFSDAVIELKAKAASIYTRVEMRDDHLRSADFFDVEKYPEIYFKSTSIKPLNKNNYRVEGNLTMHGITKPVTMNLEYRGTIENPMNKKKTAGFTATGSLKRSDFDIGPKFPAPMLSDEVRIKADGEFSPQ